MKFLFFSVSLFLVNMTANAQGSASFKAKYPDTKMVDQVDDFFGTKVLDPYRWLENDTSAETKDWVIRQNKVTAEYLAKIPFRDKIKKRMAEIWNYEKYSAPFREGAYTYFYKNNGLQNQSVLYRQKGKETPKVFLDPNTFSKDGTTSLGGVDFSKDGSLAAYQLSEGGSDWRKLVVINTKTMKRLEDTLYNIKFSGISWRHNDGFYYSSYDKPKDGSALSGKTQYHKLYYHKLGTPQASDVLIFGGLETPRRYISGAVTEDQDYLIISAANSTYGNELYIMNLKEKGSTILPIATGFDHTYDVVYGMFDKLYVLTDKDAPNSKLVRISAVSPDLNASQLIIPESENPLSVTTCGNKLFAHYLKNALSEVKQYNTEGEKEMDIPSIGLGTLTGFSGKFEDTETYFTFTSYKDPATIYKYDFRKGKSILYKKPKLKFDPKLFVSEQVFYASKDGTKIPMILTHYVMLHPQEKPRPVMLYGYGGFNVSLTPTFSASNIAFLENGGIYAVANLRGGAEYGENWHQAGTKMNKQNVFDDFIAAAEYLIKENYTTKDLLAISGASNGGLLIGACMTQRPDLFKVCFPAVGVMDMLRYNKFTAGAGWASDYGTAQDSKEMFEYLYKYSPVHNVKPHVCYPATMVTTADHDDRVVPAHSFKFAASLQAAQACDNPVLISIETKAGHGAGKPTSMLLQEQADKWSFMFWNMGLIYDPHEFLHDPTSKQPHVLPPLQEDH